MKEKIFAFVSKHRFALAATGLFLVSAFALFFGLWKLPINSWDEARHGVNAYEMIQHHDYVANYYHGILDYWNLKPPLSYYSIILAYWIFGYNAFALRFFSAFCFLLIEAMVLFYVRHKYGNGPALLSMVSLMGCWMLFIYHGARSGDADALFMFFFAGGYISLSLSSEKPNWILPAGLCFACMFLTKSWHAICFIPLVFFYLLWTKGFKNVGWWRLILFFLLALGPIGIWVLVRYHFDGWTFLRQMVEYDLLNRSSNQIEGHQSTPFFYLKSIAFNPPLLIGTALGIAYFILVLKRKQKLSNEAKLTIIAILSIFGLFTLSSTRLDWYVFNGYIPLCICTGVLLPRFIVFLGQKEKPKLKKASIIVSSLALSISSLVSCSCGFMEPKGTEYDQIISGVTLRKYSTVYVLREGPDMQGFLLTLELYYDATYWIGTFDDFVGNPNSYMVISPLEIPSVYVNVFPVINVAGGFVLLSH